MKAVLSQLRTALVIALSLVVAAALLVTNLTVAAVGASTLPADAPGLWGGLIKLLIVIASWPWWAFGGVLMVFVAAYLLQVFKMLVLIRDAQALPDRISSLEVRYDSFINSINLKIDAIYAALQENRELAGASTIRRESTLALRQEASDLWRTGIALGQSEGSINEDWERRAYAFEQRAVPVSTAMRTIIGGSNIWEGSPNWHPMPLDALRIQSTLGDKYHRWLQIRQSAEMLSFMLGHINESMGFPKTHLLS